jgi:hypothetical protein
VTTSNAPGDRAQELIDAQNEAVVRRMEPGILAYWTKRHGQLSGCHADATLNHTSKKQAHPRRIRRRVRASSAARQAADGDGGSSSEPPAAHSPRLFKVGRQVRNLTASLGLARPGDTYPRRNIITPLEHAFLIDVVAVLDMIDADRELLLPFLQVFSREALLPAMNTAWRRSGYLPPWTENFIRRIKTSKPLELECDEDPDDDDVLGFR